MAPLSQPQCAAASLEPSHASLLLIPSQLPFARAAQRNGDAKTLASVLYYEMEKKGYKCWLDVMMPEQDRDAMREGVENSDCVLAIITGGQVTGDRYFERELCVRELQWAIDAKKASSCPLQSPLCPQSLVSAAPCLLRSSCQS